MSERLDLVQQQIATIEAERDLFLRPGVAPEESPPTPGTDLEPAAAIALLSRFRGIGANDATLLTHEVFYRSFRNRRDLASWAGLTPRRNGAQVGTRT